MNEMTRTEFKQVMTCIALALICFWLAACQTAKKGRHPCNATPPSEYPAWCLGIHRQLPAHVRALYPPSPRPNGSR